MNCCNHKCNEGRTCPARMATLRTRSGGEQVDTSASTQGGTTSGFVEADPEQADREAYHDLLRSAALLMLGTFLGACAAVGGIVAGVYGVL